MRTLLAFIVIVMLLVGGSFLWFLEHMPENPTPASVQADAIIVLTGGTGRVEHGLTMLADGSAPVVFISGVGKHVTRRQLIGAHSTPEIAARIAEREAEVVLGYRADTTQRNAIETEDFVKARKIKRIRLVTANYHMPRSILVFETLMPELVIIPDPVFPAGFRRHDWWRHEQTQRLLVSEFKKYLAAQMFGWVGKLADSV